MRYQQPESCGFEIISEIPQQVHIPYIALTKLESEILLSHMNVCCIANVAATMQIVWVVDMWLPERID